MATVSQIYQIVNDSAREALGSSAITVKDTGTLVSLGNVVFSSTDNKDAFYKTLVDRIGRTAIAVREYRAQERSVKRDELEWGLIYQKISFKPKEAVENPSWVTDTQANPFDVEPSTEIVQKLFAKISTWSYEDSIPDYQLFTAFTSAERMGAFISGIYTNIENAMNIAEENMANLAVSTYMAGALIKGKTTQKRNLLREYNSANPEANLTPESALRNADFLKYAGREIKTTIGNMKKMSVLYNAENIPRHTPEDKMVVEVLGQFASAVSTYLESDTFHKELVSLPRYEEVTYWQASGTDFGFNSVSKINISNIELATEANEEGAIEQGGIIAFVHDYDAVASIITRFRDNSIYNPRAERLNIFKKADKGYACDLSENGVVFYLEA